MNRNEQIFRKTCGSIGISMLVFLLLINLLTFVLDLANRILNVVDVDVVTANIVFYTIYAAGYLTAFMLPAIILRPILRRRGLEARSMRTELRVTPMWLLAIPAGIAIIFSAAFLNSLIVELLDFLPDVIQMPTAESEAYTPAPYEWVLQFMVICVVPGFCEEFFFRGAILENCLPFGRSNAILISSFLFAVMHQNPAQLFYAFAAGVVLGVLYERTGSIWPGTLLHTMNNFASLGESIVPYRLGEVYLSYLVTTAFELAIAFVGMVCLVILVARYFSKKRDFGKGVFGSLPHGVDTAPAYPIESGHAVRLFLTPTMVVFLAFCVLEVGLLLLMGGLYG